VKIKIGFSDHFRRARHSQPPHEGIAAPQKSGLKIFEINPIRNIFQQCT